MNFFSESKNLVTPGSKKGFDKLVVRRGRESRKKRPRIKKKEWRKCMGIEPTCRLAQTAHRI